MKKYGVRIEIDDFGSGYSSLSYLQHFSIHALKIDRSFIIEMSRTQRGKELVASMVNMTRNLGISCIAEGIETREQLKDLADMRCPLGQGYLLSRPVQEKHAEGIFAHGLAFD